MKSHSRLFLTSFLTSMIFLAGVFGVTIVKDTGKTKPLVLSGQTVKMIKIDDMNYNIEILGKKKQINLEIINNISKYSQKVCPVFLPKVYMAEQLVAIVRLYIYDPVNFKQNYDLINNKFSNSFYEKT